MKQAFYFYIKCISLLLHKAEGNSLLKIHTLFLACLVCDKIGCPDTNNSDWNFRSLLSPTRIQKRFRRKEPHVERTLGQYGQIFSTKEDVLAKRVEEMEENSTGKLPDLYWIYDNREWIIEHVNAVKMVGNFFFQIKASDMSPVNS